MTSGSTVFPIILATHNAIPLKMFYLEGRPIFIHFLNNQLLNIQDQPGWKERLLRFSNHYLLATIMVVELNEVIKVAPEPRGSYPIRSKQNMMPSHYSMPTPVQVPYWNEDMPTWVNG
jgi:hypothetical protein